MDVFVCVTGPSSPGLSIRTTTFTFVGEAWFDVAVAFDACVVGALCSAFCDWPEEPDEAFALGCASGAGAGALAGALAGGLLPPLCACELCCRTVFVFPDVLEAVDELVC